MAKIVDDAVNFSARKQYLNSITDFIDSKFNRAHEKRLEYLLNTDYNTKFSDYKNMLGWPVNATIPNDDRVIYKTFVAHREGIDIFRMQFDILGIKVYGILFIPNKIDRPLPFCIVQHGGYGTPELIGSMLDSSLNYNDIIVKLNKYNVIAFAPQMLIWLPDWFGTEYDRDPIDSNLRQLGSSSKSLELFLQTRLIDYFSAQDYVDNSKIGYMGLSWGGMFALHMGALDTRIKVTYSSSYFNDRKIYPWAQWSHPKQAYNFFDSTIASLILPRHLIIEAGAQDPIFNIEGAKREYEDLEKYINKYNYQDKILVNFHQGDHEFDKNPQILEWFVEKLKN